MITTTEDGGSHRSSKSISGASIVATLIPTLVVALIYFAIFITIRNSYRKFYAPRTFLGTIPEKDRTPQSSASATSWFHDYRTIPDRFVLQHHSLDAYLFLRFLRLIIWFCFLGCCITFPILIPINATGGGTATQLDRISFSNIAKNDHIWAHVIVAWVFFGGLLVLIARERLKLIGIRQAYLVNESNAQRLSARTVLFLNASPEACQSENLHQYFGEDAQKGWPVRDLGELEALVSRRNETAFALESAETELIIEAVKHQKRTGKGTNGSNAVDTEEGRALVPKSKRPTKRTKPLVGAKFDLIDETRKTIGELVEKIDSHQATDGKPIPERSAIFVVYKSQAAAHRAFQTITLSPPMPIRDRFLAVQPKEVLWKNLAMPIAVRLSKASTALVFVVVFTIFFSIPVGIIGSISNANYLANRFEWLSWIHDLPDWVLGLLSGFVPPFLTSWFVSYVPKLFRHIAKLSGEPTTSQAELKTQAWYFFFQVFQVFLVTTFSSGAAAAAAKIAKHPEQAPFMLAESLPKASTFYLTYFILQGIASSVSTVLNYSDLFSDYLIPEYLFNKTPRQHFNTYAQMKGTPWASWLPKFTNFLVIAIAYSCVAPLVLGFASIGIFLFYLAYRYQLLYAVQAKVDTKGEAYKRALQHMPTGIYIAELCLIGLCASRKAPAQTALMIVLLVLTALMNFFFDRTLRPLELYLGVDIWQELELSYAQDDGVDTNDPAALHAASHGRRLGLSKLPHPGPRVFSDLFDSIVSGAREEIEHWLNAAEARETDPQQPKEEDIGKAYLAPALTSKTPKLWIPSDRIGVSKEEIQQNKEAGITTTNEAAEIDEDGKLHWDHRFENVPIWKAPQNF